MWDPGTQRFFVSIPNVSTTNPTLGALFRINPLTATLEAKFDVTFCAPAGLPLNPTNNTLLLGCSVVFDEMGNMDWNRSEHGRAEPGDIGHKDGPVGGSGTRGREQRRSLV